MLLSFGVLSFATCCAWLTGLRVPSSLLTITHQFTLLTHLLRHLTRLPILPLLALALLFDLTLRSLARLLSHFQPTVFLTFHTPPIRSQLQGQDSPLIFQAL